MTPDKRHVEMSILWIHSVGSFEYVIGNLSCHKLLINFHLEIKKGNVRKTENKYLKKKLLYLRNYEAKSGLYIQYHSLLNSA